LQDRYGTKQFIVGCSLCLLLSTLSYRFISHIRLAIISAVFQGAALGCFAGAVAQFLQGVKSELNRTLALSLFSMSHLLAATIGSRLALTMDSHMETGRVLRLETAGDIVAILHALWVRQMTPEE
jgi:MFS family permease